MSYANWNVRTRPNRLPTSFWILLNPSRTPWAQSQGVPYTPSWFETQTQPWDAAAAPPQRWWRPSNRRCRRGSPGPNSDPRPWDLYDLHPHNTDPAAPALPGWEVQPWPQQRRCFRTTRAALQPLPIREKNLEPCSTCRLVVRCSCLCRWGDTHAQARKVQEKLSHPLLFFLYFFEPWKVLEMPTGWSRVLLVNACALTCWAFVLEIRDESGSGDLLCSSHYFCFFCE